MMILLGNQGVDFEAVFVDHGGDYPQTYEYVAMLQKNGYPIKVLDCKINGLNLYEYSYHYKILPSRWMRWCTAKFKIAPLYKYFSRPCVVFIGFDAEEDKRVLDSRELDIFNEFPLIENRMNRKDCENYIKAAGFTVPRKSGCFFCPYAKKKDFKQLRDQEPALWCKTKKLEDAAIARRTAQGKTPIYLRDMPLNAVVQEGQSDLWGLRKPCQCGM